MAPLRNELDQAVPFLAYTDSAHGDPEKAFGAGPTRRRTFVSHALVFLLTTLLWLLLLLRPASVDPLSRHPTSSPSHRHNITSHATLHGCGASVAEARSLGCHYDLLLNHWIPSACGDVEFTAEYLEDDSWGGYADANLTEKLDVDEMSERDHYWTSHRDHVNHCAVMWKRQFWALYEEREAVDSVSLSPGHTDHCAWYLSSGAERGPDESTRVEVGFAGCWVRK